MEQRTCKMTDQSEYRLRNYKKNTVSGIINKFVTLLLPFATRTCLLYVLGIEYVGLNGLFTAILQMLSLAELGFGSAIVYSMYKPIAVNDTKHLSALLFFYKKVYRIVGAVILGIGLCLMPFIDKMIDGGIPNDINIYWLYLIYLLNTSASYFLYAYRTAVLNAYQRGYICSWISCIYYFLLYLFQIIVLLAFKSYYLYIGITPVVTVAINLTNGYISKILYPQVKCEGSLREAEKKSIYYSVISLMWHKIGNTLIYSFDSIVISSFLGLAALGRYNNYYYIYNAIAGFFSTFYFGVTSGIGNFFLVEDKEKVLDGFFTFTFFNMFFVGVSACILLCMYQDFVFLWIGSNDMLPSSTVFLMVAYFYVWHSRRIIHTFKDAAGSWREDKFRPIIEGMVNLVINVALVDHIGLNGVIISTMISMIFVGMPWEIKVFVKDHLGIEMSKYWRTLGGFYCVFCVLTIVVFFVTDFVSVTGIIAFAVKFLLCALLAMMLFGLVYKEDKNFKKMLKCIKK